MPKTKSSPPALITPSGHDLSTTEGRAAWANYMSEKSGRLATQIDMYPGTARDPQKRRSTIAAVRALQLETDKLTSQLYHGRPALTFSRGYLPVPLDLILADDISALDKLVWLIIYRYTFSNRAAWPSQETISQEVNRSIRTVRRALINLSNKGYIHITLKRHRNGCFINQYLLNLEDISNVKRSRS